MSLHLISLFLESVPIVKREKEPRQTGIGDTVLFAMTLRRIHVARVPPCA